MLRQGVLTPQLEYTGYTVDGDLKYSPYMEWLTNLKGDKHYSHFPFFFPWLSLFFYKILGSSGLYVFPVLSGIFSMFAMYHIALRFFNKRTSLSCAILLGLGTPIFFYSLNFWEHSLAFLFGILILLLSVKVIEGKRVLLLFFPPLIMLCGFLRSESIIFFFSLLLAGSIVFWEDLKEFSKVITVACIVFLVFIGVLVVYSLATSNTFFGPYVSKHFFNSWMICKVLIPDYNRLRVVYTLFFRTDLEQCFQKSAVLMMVATLMVCFGIVLMKRSRRCQNSRTIHFTLCLSLLLLTLMGMYNIKNPKQYLTFVGLFEVTPFVIFSFFLFLENSNDRLLRYIKLSTFIYLIAVTMEHTCM